MMDLYERYEEIRIKLIREFQQYEDDDECINRIKSYMEDINEIMEEMVNER